MRKIKRFTLNKILISLLAPLMCVTLALGLFFSNKSAGAMTSYPWPGTTTITDELFNYETASYNKNALDELARAILGKRGDTSTNISTLIKDIKDTAKTHGKAVTPKNITVAYGRYGLTSGTEQNQLVWMPVYMSTNRSGDAVLTLYLAATGGSRSGQEISGFTNVNPVSQEGQYTDQIDCGAPSNMYGGSYIRSATLGNQSKYYSYKANHGADATPNNAATLQATSSHKYLDFQTYNEGTGKDVVASMGYLYEDLVTPSEMLWQSYESYAECIGDKGVIVNGKGEGLEGGGADWREYCFPNEAYDAPRAFRPESSSTTITPKYNNTKFDYQDKSQYSDWQNDKVWLPSLSEVGTADWDGESTEDLANLNGLWKLTAMQRGNPSGAGASWLRTANTAYNMNGTGRSTYTIFCCEEDGSIGTHTLKEVNLAVRPAIHLNLDTALKKVAPPVALPATVTTPYIGEELFINDILNNVPSSKSWFKSNKMNVRFFPNADCNLSEELGPINAGTYYMKVYLDAGDLYFAKAPVTQREKVVKFVVEKAKIGVKWVYTNNRATDLKPVTGTIYDWDRNRGMEPEIGITYQSSTGKGDIYDKFEDLLRSNYFAYGTIKGSDLFDYNYELYDVDHPDLTDSKTGKPLVKSDEFHVGRKILEAPYFLGYDSDVTEITLSYAADQFVKLVGENKYFNITVTADPTCKGEAKKLGIDDDGYLTFKVSERGTYTFTINFTDDNYFTWPGTPYDPETDIDADADVSTKTLKVTIVRANVDVEIVDLDAEIKTVTPASFRVIARGIYELPDTDDVKGPVQLGVYYRNNKTGYRTDLTVQADGTYKFNTDGKLAAGEYTMYVTLSDPRCEENYILEGTYKVQRFRVIQVVSDLSDNDIKWQYKHNNATSAPFGFADHDTEENAVQFEFDDAVYEFSLTLNDKELHDKYYVQTNYEGDTSVKDAGLHSVEVTISAFSSGVQFKEVKYTVYFYIKPLKLDLSKLEWDYDKENPPVYDGAAKKIQLTKESLNLYPGLTVDEYECEDAISAGIHKTTVKFKLSGTYETNYVLPKEDDINSYEGEFAFTCEWVMSKAKIVVEWEEPKDDDSSDDQVVLFIPKLKKDGEYVDYIYEHQESDGSWKVTEELTAAGIAETYRVKAVVKAAYANNYELENDTYKEFEVASGKHPVIIHFEHNGETVEDGAEFPYSGEPVSLSLKVDGVGISLKEYSFKYYSVEGGRTELAEAPTEVGSYAAVVTAKYGTDTYVSKDSSTEILFDIVKADFDISQIFWIYEHGTGSSKTVITASYDVDQGKWIDHNGKEVFFSFEYDGTPHTLTVSCQQEFADSIDYIRVKEGSMKGNSTTNAGGPYSAYVDFEFNDDHYNSPLSSGFPAKLSWEITKKQINYSEVRWGYVDADGNEKDFDFDNDAFMFTRNENGVVGITVQLIGLPQGVQDLIQYKTQDLSVTGSPTTDGNTRYVIGEYITTFTIDADATWSDPNHADFSGRDFPQTINELRRWQIVRRDLSKLDYQNGFTTFDDRVHSVIDLCNIPEEDLDYITIDITFIDSTGVNVKEHYAGYEDVANMIYGAGEYTIYVYELVGEEEIPFIWDSVKINVAKNVLIVYWDENGSYPVARVKDLYATDMVGTKYFTSKDAEVSIAYVKATKGEDFYAMACVTEAYKRNIDIILDGDEKVNFTYHPYDPSDYTGTPEELPYPIMSKAHIEFTGQEIEFVIDEWEYYSQYLYISDGNLVQVAEGEYHVLLRFKKNVNAYWKTPADGETYNRNAYLLTFYIDPPTKWGLPYPDIPNRRVEWTGNPIEFKITNWVGYSKYVDYKVIYKGEVIGDQTTFRNGTFKFTDGGTYTIVFTIPDGSIGYWISKPETKEYSISLMIKGDPENPAELAPELDRTSAEYTGSGLMFTIVDWAEYAQHVQLDLDEGVAFSNGVFTAIGVGTYNVKLKIKAGSSATFVGGLTEYTLSFSIEGESGEIKRPSLNVKEQEYTGKELTFSINDWTKIYSQYLDITCENDAVTVEGGVFKVTAPGTYTITLTFKDGIEAVWADTKNSLPMNLTFIVKAVEVEGTAYVPSFVQSEKQYTGKNITFELSNYNSAKVEIVEGISYLTQKDVAEYQITLRLKNGNMWAGKEGADATKDVTLTFKITKVKIPSGGQIGVGSDGKPVIVDENGKPIPGFDFDFGDLIDVEYYDKDGNKVDAKDLVPGESYTVKFIVKDDAKFDGTIEGGSSIRDQIAEKNDNGGFVIIEYKPSGSNGDNGGFNPLWWIAIVGGILAVVAIIGVIIALATRNNGGDDGYDDYGDDYDDDDYDDDDYDDDEDYDDYDDEY